MQQNIKEVEIGKLPPVGILPEKMHAWTIRSDRLGNPLTAFRDEIVDVPKPKAGEVIIANVAAGINFNGVWAAKGSPVDVIKNNGAYGDESQPFHICGSEASGIVYAVGEGVTNVKVGDKVSVIGYQYDRNCPMIKAGVSPEYSPTYHIWGYEGNWGAFAQFSKVADYQCIPIMENVSWIDAASFSATGIAVYRMLTHWQGNSVKKGDVVLIWGGAGGIGTMAIKLVKYLGGIPVAVVSSEEKGRICMELGAKGYINRKDFDHWGSIEKLDEQEYKKWLISATKFRNRMFKIVGEKRLADIVIEHPGASTLATSLFLCAPGGMVVLCGATTGYISSIDLRYLWMSQKRIQGSHAANRQDAAEFMKLASELGIRPLTNIIKWEELPQAHMDMAENKEFFGKKVMEICSPDYVDNLLNNNF